MTSSRLDVQNMEPTIAFLSQGRLFVRESGQPVREIDSHFAKEAMDREARYQGTNQWKARSGVWGNMGMSPPQWGQWEDEAAGRRRIRFAGVSRGIKPGTLLYVLDMENVTGLFEYDLTTGIEKRLVHRNGFIARDLICHPEQGTLAISTMQDDGSAHLAFSDTEGRFWNNVSGGDSLDQMPSWIPGGGRRVVFQSAAIGRNEAGYVRGLGPYAVETLDLDGDGHVTQLHRDDKCDLLQPRCGSDGSLFFIRRPYQPRGHQKAEPLEVLKDVALFPFRLLRAFVYFLNFFSMMFSGKPLATTLGERAVAPRDRVLMLWGHMIDTKKALARVEQGKSKGLVPRDWQLIYRHPNSAETVLAENVLAFDLVGDDRVICSNGTVVWLVTLDGQQMELCREPMIEQVIHVK